MIWDGCSNPTQLQLVHWSNDFSNAAGQRAEKRSYVVESGISGSCLDTFLVVGVDDATLLDVHRLAGVTL